ARLSRRTGRSASTVSVLSILRDCLDALLHPSARYDALTRARHRAFMAPRLLSSLVALAAFPIYLAMRGAPTALEVAAFAWLIAPILLSWFLSRTGRYEGAHILSALALAGLVMMVAITTGGIESFAAVWLIVVPLEAALSASRRVVAFASALALACVAVLGAPGARLTGHGLFDRVHVVDRPAYLTALSDAARGSEQRVEFRLRRDAVRGQNISADFIWVEMRCRLLEQVSSEADVVAVMRD